MYGNSRGKSPGEFLSTTNNIVNLKEFLCNSIVIYRIRKNTSVCKTIFKIFIFIKYVSFLIVWDVESYKVKRKFLGFFLYGLFIFYASFICFEK